MHIMACLWSNRPDHIILPCHSSLLPSFFRLCRFPILRMKSKLLTFTAVLKVLSSSFPLLHPASDALLSPVMPSLCLAHSHHHAYFHATLYTWISLLINVNQISYFQTTQETHLLSTAFSVQPSHLPLHVSWGGLGQPVPSNLQASGRKVLGLLLFSLSLSWSLRQMFNNRDVGGGNSRNSA